MDSALNIFDATAFPPNPDHPGLHAFITNTRAFLPKLTLSVNNHGIWLRSTTAALSAQAFFSALDYFQSFYISPEHPILQIPILSHELDAVLSPLTATSNSSSMVRFEIRSTDRAHLHVSTTHQHTSERAMVRICTPHPPFASGEELPGILLSLPRLLSPEIYPVDPQTPLLFSTRNFVAPKQLLRIMRAHKATKINLDIGQCGRLIISSEYGGNARQSEIGGWTMSGDTTEQVHDGPRTYLSGLIMTLLKIFVRVDSTRFRIDREHHEEEHTPLQILGTLGHVSHIRFFICDSAFHFTTN